MDKLTQAREYIKNNSDKIILKNRDKYHFTVKLGWNNDPNGFSFFEGKYHLFYQYYPYDTKWGQMHWGHAISEDLVSFIEQEVAMAPSEDYDNDLGCFSGSAIVKDDILYAVYTGVGNNKQTQNLAHLEGNQLIKYPNNPIIDDKMLPNGYDITNFRDPYILYKNDYYYIFVGAKKLNNDASILLYKSKDLIKWQYVNIIYNRKDNNGMLECPSVAFFDDKMVLLFSPQEQKSTEIYNNQNPCSVMYVIGKMDFEKDLFTPLTPMIEIDKGFDFYAPQILTHNQNVYMIAWMNMWDKEYVSSKDGYAGKMTIVKELTLINNHLYQSFNSQLFKYQRNSEKISNIKGVYQKNFNSPILLKIALIDDNMQFVLTHLDSKEIILSYRKEDRLITLSRRLNDGIYENRFNIMTSKDIELEIFIDYNSVEIIFDKGLTSMTSNVFTYLDEYQINIESELIKYLNICYF